MSGGKVISVGLLGELSVHVDGQPVSVGPARQRLVLAALATDADHVVSVSQLTDRVWGEDAPHRARSVLGVYVSRLRQELGSAAVAWRSGGYVLVIDRMAVDTHRFHDLCVQARTTADDAQAVTLLTEALRSWRGPALTGLDSQWHRLSGTSYTSNDLRPNTNSPMPGCEPGTATNS
jgi:DNA-binding SARP family transcriptional activator